MSTSWRFEVGGIYEHVISHRKVLILHEQRDAVDPLNLGRKSEYRHAVAIPLDKTKPENWPYYLQWNYPPQECSESWELVGRVAVNPRTSEAERLYIEHRDSGTHTGDVYVEGCPTCYPEGEP
jgi:hypothetical protein